MSQAGSGLACQDACFQAVQGFSNGLVDCNSYLLTTVTPPAKTVQVTQHITITPTVDVVHRITETVRDKTTKTKSVVETTYLETLVSHVRTITKTITDSTVTVTTTAQPDGLGIQNKRRNAVATDPHNTPAYASTCGNIDAYKSACLCVGATSSTKTAACPTVTKTATKTATASAKTHTCYETVKKTVWSTIPVTKTFSTVTQATDYKLTTDIATIDAIATIVSTVPSPFTTLLLLNGGGNYANIDDNDANLQGNAIAFDATREGDASYFVLNSLDGTISDAYDPSIDVSAGYTLHLPAQLDPVYYPTAYVFYQGEGYSLECELDKKDNKLLCVSSSPGQYDGVWWTCGGHLMLAVPGFDVGTFCEDNVASQIDLRVYLGGK